MVKKDFRSRFILLFILSLFLAACNGEEEDTTNSEKPEDNAAENEEVEASESVEEEETILNQLESVEEIESREEMKVQKGGTLTADISLEEEQEEATDKKLDATLVEDLTEELEKLTVETQDPAEIHNAFVHLLGTPHYKELIEDAENFSPDFEEPFLPDPGKSQEEVENEPEKGKAIILLDASSSMLLSVDNEVKMDIAKDAVKQFGATIGQDNDISLVVYGHKGSESEADKELSCNGIEEIYPMGAYDEETFVDSLSTFESKGYTPLAGAINKAAEMSEDFTDAVTVYIVSDGVETCDGNPVKEAEAFIQNNEDRSVNIIGFNVDQDAEDQLNQVSEAGNGEYFAADDADELKDTIEKKWLPSNIDLAWAFKKAPGPWEIKAEYDRFDEDHLESISNVMNGENSRYMKALQILIDEELVDSEVSNEVRELIQKRNNRMSDLVRDFRSEKIDEIDGIAEDIRQKVDEWTEEMKKQKEERGDLF